MSEVKKLIILGSGPAGYSASIYAARAGLDPVLITGLEVGGQLTTTTDVENWPGDHDDLQGPDLMVRMQSHAEKFNVEIINDHIETVDISDKPIKLRGNNEYLSESLIIATGASAQYLGLDSEQKFLGRGVSACATCDGFFFKDKEVIVVGGGNSAVEEALYLTGMASKVYLVHRRDTLRAEKILQDRLFANEKIECIWNSQVEEILGDENPNNVTGVKLKDTVNGSIRHKKIDGVFIAIGHDPATGIFKGQVDMDSQNYILTLPDSTATSVEGVFAAGDVKDKVYRQAVTAAGMGCMAALEAEKYLASKESK